MATTTTHRTTRRVLGAATAAALAFAGIALTAAPAQALPAQVTTLSDVVDPLDGVVSLREAVAQAELDAAEDAITFQPGLTGTIALTSTLTITQSVIIDGSGAAIVISRDNTVLLDFDLVVADLLPGGARFTLIDVDIVGDGLAPVQLGRGLVVRQQTGAVDIGRVQLTDVTIANHRSPVGVNGAGAYIRDSLYLDVLRSTFSSNQADSSNEGGGLYYDGDNSGSLHVTDSRFVSNTAGIGGGIAVDDTNGVWVDRSFFQLNNAVDGTGGAFKAEDIAIDGVFLTDSTFDENTATIGGGAVFTDDTGNPSITRSVFTNNKTTAGAGGAVLIASVNTGFTVSDSIFTANTSATVGGALAAMNVEVGETSSVAGSTFSGNDSANGGVSLLIGTIDGSFRLSNSTLDELVAGPEEFAFAIFQTTAGSTTVVSNSTIVGPGAVAVVTSDGSTVIENSILVRTPGTTQGTVTSNGGAQPIVVRYGLIVGALGVGVTNGVGNVTTTDAQLEPLAANGGPTPTRLLKAGSPARDAGDPAFVAPPNVDQRGAGFARVLNGRLDIGAVEAVAVLPETGQNVSWWLLPVAGGVVVLGILALLIVRLRPSGRRRA